MTTLRKSVPLLAAFISVVLAPAAPAQGVDQTCVLALTKFDPATVNVAFPDDSAVYYGGVYALVPGTRIRITGEFPHARYMSFNLYDPQLRPIAAISDVQIRPDAGSANPFLPGADRTGADHRSYTVVVEPGPAPGNPPPNTLYPSVGQDGSLNLAGLFLYRVYVPDAGRDESGGVGLPTVTIEQSAATTAPAASSPCAQARKPALSGINELLAAQTTPADLPLPGGANPPVWRRFVNLASSVAVNVLGSPAPGGVDLDALGGNGGFLSNRDNQYVSAPINRSLGQVVVTRMRVPTFPDTRPPAATMPEGQLRYWSLCQNDPITQRFVACVNDDRAVRDDDGYATFVVSAAGKRPPSARAACGVNWLPWGLNQRGVLIYRNMLPADSFRQAIQFAKVDHEAATMGEYLPASRYYADAAAYERAVGCDPPTSSRRARAGHRIRSGSPRAGTSARARARRAGPRRAAP